MLRSSGQSDAKLLVLSSRTNLVLIYRGLNLGPMEWKRDALTLSHWAPRRLISLATFEARIHINTVRAGASSFTTPGKERKMFKNCRKEDLRIVALELGETVAEKVTIVELTEIIKENKYFKEDVEFVKELIQYTIENRKRAEEDRKRVEEDRKRMQIEEDRKKEAENRLREKRA
ncbi:hypothetical protein TNCV_4430121 [Trichonephila clavipes]|nr:hypothetical protein TNCV_4430121 [Trichonephila clavipes]